VIPVEMSATPKICDECGLFELEPNKKMCTTCEKLSEVKKMVPYNHLLVRTKLMILIS